MSETRGNSGHGHVWKRPDGMRARCGGPAICGECAKEQAMKLNAEKPDAHWIPKEQYDALQAEVARLREALEWYAALGSWSIDRTGLSPAHRDMGQRARRFLAEPAAPQPEEGNAG